MTNKNAQNTDIWFDMMIWYMINDMLLVWVYDICQDLVYVLI